LSGPVPPLCWATRCSLGRLLALSGGSKFMDIRVFKVREWIDEGALVTTYYNTLSMAAC
jgi:hypothetical protein